MAAEGRSGTEERGAKAETSKPGRRTPSESGVPPEKVKEIGGPKGPEPTRYGDWEKGGRCSDF